MEAVVHLPLRAPMFSPSHAISPATRPAPPPPLGLALRLPPADRLRPSRTPCSRRISNRARHVSPAVTASLLADDLDVVPMTSTDPVDHQQGDSFLMGIESLEERSAVAPSPGGFSPDPPYAIDLTSVAASSPSSAISNEVQVLMVTTAADVISIPDDDQFVDRAINAMIVGAAGAFAITKILTVDRDYWHGWTMFEILRYAPLHNWSAYEQALKANPLLAKMMISGVVYSIGDWIAQCYEGKPILEISRKRMIRSGLVGFCLHGSLSHFYYHVCEAIFPFKGWWVVPIKVAFDQTLWSAFWNSIYFIMLGILRLESPKRIASELRSTFWPMLTAGWKLWPFAHLITYGAVPLEQRLLWVDCVELVWVTILSMYSNEKAEARKQDESLSDMPLIENSTELTE